MREYKRHEVIIANLPYMAMVALGAAIIAMSFGVGPWALAGALGFLAYGVGGTLLLMLFVCPYCAYYDTHSCPCGYGVVSSKLVKKGDRECFADKFKRHIPLIVPLWLIPVVCAGYAVMQSFTWPLTILTIAFAINSYAILPLVAGKHGCAECPQKDDCPWMAHRVKRS